LYVNNKVKNILCILLLLYNDNGDEMAKAIYNGKLEEDNGYLGKYDKKVYEVVRIKNSQAYFLNEHLERLAASLKSLNIEKTYNDEIIKNSIDNLIRVENIKDDNIWIEFYYNFNKESNIYIHKANMVYPDYKMYNEGVVLKTIKLSRENPHIKEYKIDYKNEVSKFITEIGCYEAVLWDGVKVTEGSRSNLFFIKNEVIHSALSKDILIGVTYKNLIEMLKTLEIRFIEHDILLDEVNSYDSCFITGTSIEILPVSAFNQKVFDVNNPVLRKLMEKFNKFGGK
jgi:branched-chain amino acid aminotransferase